MTSPFPDSHYFPPGVLPGEPGDLEQGSPSRDAGDRDARQLEAELWESNWVDACEALPQVLESQAFDQPLASQSSSQASNSLGSNSPEAGSGNLVAELDQVVQDFEAIQAELQYRQAQETLDELVHQLDLTPREQAGLEAEIGSLTSLLNKLEQSVIQIAAFGLVGRGKSSVLNALLGQSVFETGVVHGVTREIQRAEWQEGPWQQSPWAADQKTQSGRPERQAWTLAVEEIDGSDRPIHRAASVPIPQPSGLAESNIATRIELIDTPGIDEVQGEARAVMAQQVAQQADLLLFVVAGDITRVEYEALSLLRAASKPILLVFNKVDQYPEADRLAIYETIRDQRVRDLLSPDEIVMAAASPRVAIAAQQSDGSLTTHLQPGPPQVNNLKLKILEILQREGKALMALNTLLYANDVNEQLVQRKLQIRDRAANQVIWKGVMTKAVAIALNPVTVLDLLSGAVIDVALILTLSRLYGIAMNQADALDLLRKIALGLGGIGISELVATLGLGSLKGVLGLSTVTTGGAAAVPYVSVAIAQAGVAGVSSYAIGQVTKTYLANGASWGPAGPKAVVAEILTALDETSILHRIKDELRAKLDVTR